MILRYATRGDYAAMLDIYRPYVENTTISFEYVTPSLTEFSDRLDRLSDYPSIVCEEDGEIIGYAYSSPAFSRAAYGWCADLSVYVRQDKLGRGVGSALTRATCGLLKALGYRRVYSLITEGNGRSISMHEKCGFEKVAFFPEQGYKSGRWIGVFWLEKTLNGKEVGTSSPRPVSKLPADISQKILKGDA